MLVLINLLLILPITHEENVKTIALPADDSFLPLLGSLSALDDFHVLRYNASFTLAVYDLLCGCLEYGAQIVFLPESNGRVAHRHIVAETCQNFGAVCLDLWGGLKKGAIEIMPPEDALPLSLAAFIHNEGWRDVVLIFQSDEEFLSMTYLISEGHLSPFRTHLIRIPPPLNGTVEYGQALKRIKDKMGIYRIVIASEANVVGLLETAVHMSMCTSMYHYSYPVANWTTIPEHLIACNITAVALEEKKGDLLKDLTAFLSTSLDASILYGHPTCQMKWDQGAEMKNAVLKHKMDGRSGRFELDAQGRRFNYTVHLFRSRNGQLQKYAVWTSVTQQITRIEPVSTDKSTRKLTLVNQTLRVTVYMEAPFVMRRIPKEGEVLKGNDVYEGYCIDLLKLIAGILHFNYTINEVKDKSYGSREASGKWNGMVGELQSGVADLAVASLTISYSRSEVIDFTVPYMHLGISILFKKPTTSESSWFMFMSPLSGTVWLALLASYVATSVALWIIAGTYDEVNKSWVKHLRVSIQYGIDRKVSPSRVHFLRIVVKSGISPYERLSGARPKNTLLTLRNSFWFTVSSLMQQGCELSPRATSTRIVASVWWFFTIIMLSSYTANLAAFLTTKRMVTPIENADDLAKQTKIKYGTLGRGSTMSFFNESKIDTYEKMWKLMSSQPGLFVKSSKEGIARVKSSDYAYLMESSMLEYAVERDCELMQVGGLLDQKGYGIGLPKGSPYRELLSTAIMRLQEKTVLTELKEKWWKDKDTVCRQSRKKESDDGDNMSGIFILLIIGILITIVTVLAELFIGKAKGNDNAVHRGLWPQLKQALWHSDERTRELKEKIDSLISFSNGRPVYNYTNRLVATATLEPEGEFQNRRKRRQSNRY